MQFIYQDEGNTIITGIQDNPNDLIIPQQVVELKTNFLSGKTTQTISFEVESLLTTIGDSCFAHFNSLIKVDFSNCKKLSCLSFRCFFQCTKLEVCILPEHGNFTVLSQGSFAYCRSLKNFSFPSTCRVFENHSAPSTAVFDYCDSLEYVYFPKNSKLENIGTYGFIDCHSLKEIKLPSKIKKLEMYIFHNCQSPKNVFITSSPVIIATAFSGGTYKGNVYYSHPETKAKLLNARLKQEQLFLRFIPNQTYYIMRKRKIEFFNYILISCLYSK